MKISFHGAAGCITGSKHLIELETGESILLDCGMFQGMGKQTLSLNSRWNISPKSIRFLLLSHAHVDHCGLIPLLVKQGFTGRIICTEATKDLCEVMLIDCARIQEEDTYFVNKKYKRFGQPLIEPLYKQGDAIKSLQFFDIIPLNTKFKLTENVEATFFDAGHILGSAAIQLSIKENKKFHTLLFSGDVGRYNSKIITSPAVTPQASILILESTYANRCHVIPKTTKNILAHWIEKVCVQRGGILVIPAFSLGRTQELLFELNKLSLKHQLPNVQYFVDSPMSINITELFRKYKAILNTQTQKVIIQDSDRDPFWFEGLNYIETVEESKALRYKKDPFVVISSSGMGDAGRVKHHIANHITHSKNAILMSGYASSSSLCGKLLNHKKEVHIFGLNYQVHAEIGSLPGMSGHADHEQLMKFIEQQDPLHLKNIFLVHGEAESQGYMIQILKEKGYRNIYAPQLQEEVEI